MICTRYLIVVLLLLGRPAAADYASEEQAKGHVPADLPIKPVPPRRYEPVGPQHLPVVRRLRPGKDGRAAPVQGALSGKSVYLSPGHGWTYSSTNGWYTQRGNVLDLVEDLSNADGIDWFLVPYLLQAGALVVPVREIDPTEQMVILDSSDGAKDPSRGRVVESGPSSIFSDSTLKGWGHPTLPLSGSVNPFELGGNRLMDASASETARITFVPNVPATGRYNVYISYSMYEERASDAGVIVAHPGGQTRFLVDQRRQGATWVLLGRFFFEQGTDEKRGAIIFTNQSQDAGSTISADAVRLGGGTGLIDRGGGVSARARADENSRYHAQFAGAPPTVYNASTSADGTDDVSARSRFADWAHAPGEPAVYISHHTNAFNGNIRGTESYVYGPNPPDGSYQPTQTTLALGSDKLANAVHGEVIADIRAAHDPGWADRKVKSAYFGELNTANQDEMAAMLIETAFHDQKDDVDALKEASFRRLVARAIYKGIVKYFAAQEATAVHLLPEPPEGVVARNSGSGEVTVSWLPPKSGGILGDPATSYRVYRSAGGHAFDEGTDCGGKTSLKLIGLTPQHVLYLRVTATNEGGESLPTPTLAVGVSTGASAPVLLVAASDRLDASMNLKIDYPKVKTVDRLFVDQINNQTYLVQHGAALGPSGVPFDSCLHTALDADRVKLDDYGLVLWQGGRGLAGKRALTEQGRKALAAAAGAGVSLVMSGSGLARWLTTPEETTFLSSTLHASFVEASSVLTKVDPSASGALDGLTSWELSSWKTGPYDVQIPDVIAPSTGASLAATYAGAADAGAVTQFHEGSRCAVLMGHPLEAILPPTRRTEILTRLLKYCDVKVPPPPDGGVYDGTGLDGPPVVGDGAQPSGDDGCGCRVGHRGGGIGWLLAMVLVSLLHHRSRLVRCLARSARTPGEAPHLARDHRRPRRGQGF